MGALSASLAEMASYIEMVASEGAALSSRPANCCTRSCAGVLSSSQRADRSARILARDEEASRLFTPPLSLPVGAPPCTYCRVHQQKHKVKRW